jgi:uncharacterized protein DUF3800
LALDDSGTRHPTHKVGRKAKHGNDWFALGGVIFSENDEARIRDLHGVFCENWQIEHPLHSSEIRAKSNNFSFVGLLEAAEQHRFYEELYCLMRDLPVFGMSCVIDRPGYCDRYLAKYEEGKRWLLCQSAFSIVVERSAKWVHRKGGKMRVYVERADKKTDRRLKDYYSDMKANGMPFAKETSKGYEPASDKFLSQTLYEFRTKKKSSPLMQLADLFLWPQCIGGYDADNRPYKRLRNDHKLLDCQIKAEDVSKLGIKYYCFDRKKPS